MLIFDPRGVLRELRPACVILENTSKKPILVPTCVLSVLKFDPSVVLRVDTPFRAASASVETVLKFCHITVLRLLRPALVATKFVETTEESVEICVEKAFENVEITPSVLKRPEVNVLVLEPRLVLSVLRPAQLASTPALSVLTANP